MAEYRRIDFCEFNPDNQVLLRIKKEDGSLRVQLHHPNRGWNKTSETLTAALDIAEREKMFGYEPVICDPDHLLS